MLKVAWPLFPTNMDFLEKRLALYGLKVDHPLNEFKWTDNDLGAITQTGHYFSKHDLGIEIKTPDITGNQPFHVIRNKKNYVSRIRLENPIGEGKYRFSVKFKKDHEQDEKASWFFIPPRLYEAIKKEDHIRTLYLTEGEFKSYIPSMHGVMIGGIPGIHNYREKVKGRLLDALRYIIKICRVENVVFIFDGDLTDLSKSWHQNDFRADKRPRNFMSAASNIRKLLIKEHVNVFIGHLQQGVGEKGLDDLYKVGEKETPEEHNRRCQEITKDLEETFHQVETQQQPTSKRFLLYDVTEHRRWDAAAGRSYLVLPRIFRVENVVQFYEHHKMGGLKGFQGFKFNGRHYKIDDGLPVLHEDSQKVKSIVKQEGSVYTIRNKDGDPEPISNFHIKLRYVVYVDEGDTRRIGTITNILGQSRLTEFKKEHFSNPKAFLDKTLSWKDYNWYGKGIHLIHIKAMVEDDEGVIGAKMVTQLGWQSEEKVFCFANGVAKKGLFYPVNEYGIASIEEEGFCLPAFSKIDSFKEQSSEDRWMIHKPITERVDFKTYRQKLEFAHNTMGDPNGTIALLYSIMMIFSDVVFRSVRSCPLLYLTGLPKTGKNGCGKSIMAWLGEYETPTNIHSVTDTALNRLASHLRNGGVWLDEYKNDIPKWKQEMLKRAYDRTGKRSGQKSNDDKTRTTRFHSCILVSGQEIPGQGASDQAITSRGIILFFRHDDRDRKPYDELLEIEDNGITHLTIDLLSHRDLIEEKYALRFSEIQDAIKVELGFSADVRLIQNYAALITPAIVLAEAGNISLADLTDTLMGCGYVDAGEKYKTLEEQYVKLAVHKIVEQQDLLRSNDEVSVFWHIVEMLCTYPDETLKLFEGVHWKISGSELILRFEALYDKYLQYGKRNDYRTIDKGTIKQYLRNHNSFLELRRSVYYKGNVTTGMVFNRKLLPEARNIITEAERMAIKTEYENRKIQEVKSTQAAEPDKPVEKEAVAPF